MNGHTIRASAHFQHILDAEQLPRVVDQSLVQLDGLEFDTFAFIGYSGAVLAPTLAYLLKKELLMVRKNGGNDK